jgi:hypothetical protein
MIPCSGAPKMSNQNLSLGQPIALLLERVIVVKKSKLHRALLLGPYLWDTAETYH